MKDLLESDIPKVAQNGLFDGWFLASFSDIFVENYIHDTMVAQHCAYPELPKGLDFLASIYTREPYYKDEGKNWSPRDAEDVERFLIYNAKDVCTTLEVHLAQMAVELRDENYRETYEEVMKQCPVYVDMMVRGIKIDQGEQDRMLTEYSLEAIEMQSILDETVVKWLASLFESYKKKGDEPSAVKVEKFIHKLMEGYGTQKGGLNVNSTKDLRTYLYEIRKYKVKKNRKTGKPSTDEDSLKEMYAETKDPMLLTIVKIRQKRKRISAYLNLRTNSQGQTFFSCNPVKTKTGRSACGKTITGYGLNVQTVPHEMRTSYSPADGYEYAYLDLAQAEPRIVAYKGGVSRMIHAFENGEDLHSVTAAAILDMEIEDVEEYPHRYLGKRCNHAFNYEMGPYKFVTIVNRDSTDTGISLTRKEGKLIRHRHIQTYNELLLYWEMIRAQLKRNRTIINPFGRKRVFLGRLGDDLYREAFSHYAQSTVADVLRRGMRHSASWLSEHYSRTYPDTRVVLEVHDAIMIQYPVGAANEIIPEVRKLMEIPINIDGKEIIIPVDAQVGPSWGEMKKWTPA